MKSVRRTIDRVIDGDTIRLVRKIGNTDIVRLSGFNAPEKHQFGCQRATNVLRGLLRCKKVTIKPEARDRYGRIIGTVFCNRRNINKQMKKRL